MDKELLLNVFASSLFHIFSYFFALVIDIVWTCYLIFIIVKTCFEDFSVIVEKKSDICHVPYMERWTRQRLLDSE